MITDAFRSVPTGVRVSVPRPDVRQLTGAPILDIVGHSNTFGTFFRCQDNFLGGKTDNREWRQRLVAWEERGSGEERDIGRDE